MNASRPVALNPAASALSLTLYVAGDNTFSRRAQSNLQSIISDEGLQWEVNIVDVLKHPELTMRKRIFVTPALVVSSDGDPESLIIGDFSEREQVTRLLRDRVNRRK